MTSSILVVHTGGNKKLAVIVESKKTDGSWVESERHELYGPGSTVGELHKLYIHDSQRIVVEEFGPFK